LFLSAAAAIFCLTSSDLALVWWVRGQATPFSSGCPRVGRQVVALLGGGLYFFDLNAMLLRDWFLASSGHLPGDFSARRAARNP